MRPSRSRVAPFSLLFALWAAACGSDSAISVEADPDVEAFVGTWDAIEFTVSSAEDPETFFHVTDGGSFTIIVQPSGMYTAIMDFHELPNPVVEVGRMSSVGNSITLRPQGGPAATSSYRFEGGLLILDGPTQFDFNNDGVPENAVAHIVLERTAS